MKPDTQKTKEGVRSALLEPDEQEAAIAALDYHIARIESVDDADPNSLLTIRLDACKRAKEKIENAYTKDNNESR